MPKKQFHSILLAGLFSLVFASCHNEKKIYDSDDADEKKDKGIAIGKYNKLLRSGDMELKYEAAIKYYNKQDYSRALGLFEELVSVFRGTARGEEVLYYYAYSSYNLKDYIVAGYQFRNYVRQFPDNKHTEECSYMNAYCYYLSSPDYSLDQSDTKVAIKEFQRFTSTYPKSIRIEECNKILDKLRAKLERKSYENAVMYYDMLDYKAAIVAINNHLKEYPDAKLGDQLMYYVIKSYYLLAVNSIEAKKYERFKGAVDTYFKFVDAYPNSKYQGGAEQVYNSALNNLEKLNKPTS